MAAAVRWRVARRLLAEEELQCIELCACGGQLAAGEAGGAARVWRRARGGWAAAPAEDVWRVQLAPRWEYCARVRWARDCERVLALGRLALSGGWELAVLCEGRVLLRAACGAGGAADWAVHGACVLALGAARVAAAGPPSRAVTSLWLYAATQVGIQRRLSYSFIVKDTGI